MDKLALDNLPAEEQERLKQLEKELAELELVPLLEKLMASYGINKMNAAIYARADMIAFDRLLSGLPRQFTFEQAKNLLRYLQKEKKIESKIEADIWHEGFQKAISDYQPKRIERLRELVTGKLLRPLLNDFAEWFGLSDTKLAELAGIDSSVYSKILKGKHREFKAEYVDTLLNALESMKNLTDDNEKDVWRRALRIAAHIDFEDYKAVQLRLKTQITDPAERAKAFAAWLSNEMHGLDQTYTVTKGQFPIFVPLTDLVARNLLKELEREEQAPTVTEPQIQTMTQRVPANRTPRYIEPELVRIPAGEFWMGSDANDKDAYDDEKPRHKVYVADFWMARYPVTNEEYALFLRDNPAQSKPSEWDEIKRKTNHPVRYVTWRDAIAYTRWLSKLTGKRYALPTEAQWEKAARGADGRKYPWGNVWDATRCNTSESKINDTTPVGKYSPRGDSPYGIADMSGNVWEWCQSKFKSYPYRDDGREIIDENSDSRVLRGGAFWSESSCARVCYRNGDHPRNDWRGFGLRVCAAPV